MYVLLVSLSLLDYGLNLAIDPFSIALGLGALATGTISALENRARGLQDRALTEQMFLKTREWQVMDQEKQQEMTKDLMNYQYENFSSPSAQMEAYKKAGLNPWLMSQGGSVGSGQSVSPSGVHLPTGSSGVPSVMRPQYADPFSGGYSALLQGSSVQSQRIAAMSDMAKSIPSLVKGLGSDSAKRLLKSIYNQNVDSEIQDELIDIEVQRQRITKDREQLELDISKEFDRAIADVVLANLSLEGHKINAEANELYKRGKLHDTEIDELVTRSAKNLAEKAHLNADTDTINKLRPYVVKSAEMTSDMDYFDRQESAALYEQGSKARTWQISEYGKNEALQQQVVENNRNASLINRIVRGNEKRQKRIR